MTPNGPVDSVFSTNDAFLDPGESATVLFFAEPVSQGEVAEDFPYTFDEVTYTVPLRVNGI